MFEKVFIERDLVHHPKAKLVTQRVPLAKVCILDSYEDVFGKVRKPYLLKRRRLDLFLAKKRGELLKPTPPAYGASKSPRFYFVHQYNCIFECEYCFLQGYFDSPDIVSFLNHDEIAAAMYAKAHDFVGKEVWFHAGEFSDNLALSHLLDDWATYWDVMEHIPWARLELRSKSAAIQNLMNLRALGNIVVSFSMGSENQVQKYDHKTAPVQSRLKAARKLHEHGYKIGWHFDPVVIEPNVYDGFASIARQCFESVSKPEYISIGMLRFAEPVFRAMNRHYPTSSMTHPSMCKSMSSKVTYPNAFRDQALARLSEELVKVGFDPQVVYRCMES